MRSRRPPVTPRRRPRIPPAGPHGGDGPAIAASLGIPPEAVLDLSASLNPLAPDLSVVLGGHLGSLTRYPDPARATAALAGRLGVDPARVLLTNGGSEAIALVAAELPVGRVEEPDFSLYRRHLRSRDPAAPLWRSNPHNPTGVLADPGARAGVWDEAFYPLATGTWTRGDADAGSVVVGSLTKLLACPGLRVGYVLADDLLVGRLAARQPKWALNGLAASALEEVLEMVDLDRWSRAVGSLRSELAGVLSAHGLSPRPSDASYVLADGPRGLRERLAEHAVVVRDCTSFGLPGAVRVAVPCEAGLERLDAALGRALP